MGEFGLQPRLLPSFLYLIFSYILTLQWRDQTSIKITNLVQIVPLKCVYSLLKLNKIEIFLLKHALTEYVNFRAYVCELVRYLYLDHILFCWHFPLVIICPTPNIMIRILLDFIPYSYISVNISVFLMKLRAHLFLVIMCPYTKNK